MDDIHSIKIKQINLASDIKIEEINRKHEIKMLEYKLITRFGAVLTLVFWVMIFILFKILMRN